MRRGRNPEVWIASLSLAMTIMRFDFDQSSSKVS
jgi:hypothetical protein